MVVGAVLSLCSEAHILLPDGFGKNRTEFCLFGSHSKPRVTPVVLLQCGWLLGATLPMGAGN